MITVPIDPKIIPVENNFKSLLFQVTFTHDLTKRESSRVVSLFLIALNLHILSC